MTEFPFPLTSVAGVVLATIFAVQMMKGTLSQIRWLGAIPIWAYAVVVSFGLTAFSALVIHTLTGDFWALAWQAVGMAATSTGFYEWWKNKTKPLADSGAVTLPSVGTARFVKSVLLITALGLGFSPGCTALHHTTSTPTVEQQSLTDLHQTAQIAKRAGEIVSEVQQLEIKYHQLYPAKITQADHEKIQAGFGVFAHGVIISLQEAQDMTKPNANRQAAINEILDGADRFVAEYVLPIKDEQIRTGIQLGLATLRGVLNAMQLLL
jgi:hypothetical protein